MILRVYYRVVSSDLLFSLTVGSCLQIFALLIYVRTANKCRTYVCTIYSEPTFGGTSLLRIRLDNMASVILLQEFLL